MVGFKEAIVEGMEKNGFGKNEKKIDE